MKKIYIIFVRKCRGIKMAEQEIILDLEQLKQDKVRISEKKEVIKRELQWLQNELEEFDFMQKESKEKMFFINWKEDYITLEDACKEIQTYIECMEYAIKEYEDCEKKVEAAVSAIEII